MFSPEAIKKIEDRMIDRKLSENQSETFDSGCDDSDNKTISDGECEADTESVGSFTFNPKWNSNTLPRRKYKSEIEPEVSLDTILNSVSTQTLEPQDEPKWRRRKSDFHGLSLASQVSLDSNQSTREYRILPPLGPKKRRATLHRIFSFQESTES